jgi:ribosomal protein S18 acetylase RimI-like enzyme
MVLVRETVMADWQAWRDIRLQARGRGVGEALIDVVIGWARERDATSVHLWVTETNKHARLLYERCGFSLTAERQPPPSNPALGEVGMTRPLAPDG